MSVISSATAFVTQTVRYRGHEGQWAWVLHRVTGIGIFAFLVLHIFDIFLIGFGPEPFNTLAVIYHTPLARIGHVFLFFCVLYHAVNGVRIIILDFWPQLWKYQKQSVWWAAAIFLVLFIPSTVYILYDTFLAAH
jgi:succinate dehydrogenase / fumarate reductase cytochrome b subunit